MESRAAQDPMFIHAGMRPLTPLLRALGNSQSEAVVRVLGRFAAAGDPFVFGELVRLLAATVSSGQLQAIVASETAMPDELRLAALLAARRVDERQTETVAAGLSRPEPMLRRAAVQWAGEVRLRDLRPQVEAVLQSDAMTTDLFLATLAALELLDGKGPQEFDKTPPSKYVLPLLANDKTPTAVKVQALRLVDPADPALTGGLMQSLLTSPDFHLRLEAVRTLSLNPPDDAAGQLIDIARTPRPFQGVTSSDAEARQETEHHLLMLEALLGLAQLANRGGPEHAAAGTLLEMLRSGPPERTELIRALRGLSLSEETVRHVILDSVRVRTGNAVYWIDAAEHVYLALPADIREGHGSARRPSWDSIRDALLVKESEFEQWSDHDEMQRVASGRRVFFHPNGPGCSKCHTVDGRGGRVGPDLSNIGRSTSREKLIESILEPAREVAPQFTTWTMITAGGGVHTGMIVHENEGRTVLGDAEGKTVELATIDIDQRTPQQASVMPEKLHERMTVQEFRDLLAYLESLGR
jgi:putative heme-binding domain-containing protein